jgi:hypothetical protein
LQHPCGERMIGHKSFGKKGAGNQIIRHHHQILVFCCRVRLR